MHLSPYAPRSRSFPLVCSLAALATLLLLSESVSANHGPGASGGGNSVIAGETLNQGRFELSFREDYTQFQQFSRGAAASRGLRGGDFDALDHGFLTTADLAYGVTDNFQVGLALGYFFGRDF